MSVRRLIQLTMLLCSAASVLGAVVLTFRLHEAPRRTPFLTERHLADIAEADRSGQWVLFIGNSMIMNHDVPSRVAQKAMLDGYVLRTATAAAHGARLVETWRIAEVRSALKTGPWDLVVLQDFSSTALRPLDRLGSTYAIGRMTAALGATPIVLLQTVPAESGSMFYQKHRRLGVTPSGPEEYAKHTERHYANVSRRYNLPVVDVLNRWMNAMSKGLYAADGQHMSAAGADLVASAIWEEIRPLLLDQPR